VRAYLRLKVVDEELEVGLHALATEWAEELQDLLRVQLLRPLSAHKYLFFFFFWWFTAERLACVHMRGWMGGCGGDALPPNGKGCWVIPERRGRGCFGRATRRR
jgi:hypothetical protein